MFFRRYAAISRSLGFSFAKGAGVILLQLLSTFFEGIGIGMFLPIIQLLQSGGDASALIAHSRLWQELAEAFAVVGLPVSLATLLAAVFVALCLRQALLYAREMYMVRLREGLTRDVRAQVFRRYVGADTTYHDSEPIGATVNAITVELAIALDAIFSPLSAACYLIVVLGMLVVLLLASGPVATLALLALGVAGFAVAALFRKSREVSQKLRQANQEMATFLVHRLSAMRLIRLSGMEEAEIADLAEIVEKQRGSMVAVRAIRARGNAIYDPIGVAIALLLLYLGYTVFDMSLAEFGVFFVAALRLLPTGKGMISDIHTTVGAWPHLRAFEARLAKLAAAREDRPGERPFAPPREGIRFENLVYRYPGGEHPALDGVSVTIPAGKVTALVGPSGGGKSTLVDLLVRIREPRSGRILVDGAPLDGFAVDSLRRAVSYAPQRPQIFNVTVAQHIRYGKPEAREDEVIAAARKAGIHDVIAALPEGYATRLGEEASRLSGGQRQRLDLARVLVRNAPILILDEPTSQLDADAEAAFREVIGRLRRDGGATIIIIAHRLATVADADQIVVLREGTVEAAGSHGELLARGGWYAEGWRKQSDAPRAAAQ